MKELSKTKKIKVIQKVKVSFNNFLKGENDTQFLCIHLRITINIVLNLYNTLEEIKSCHSSKLYIYINS